VGVDEAPVSAVKSWDVVPVDEVNAFSAMLAQ